MFHPLTLCHLQDRTNIGNARIAGFQQDLHISNSQVLITCPPMCGSGVSRSTITVQLRTHTLPHVRVQLTSIRPMKWQLIHLFQTLRACRSSIKRPHDGAYMSLLRSFFVSHSTTAESRAPVVTSNIGNALGCRVSSPRSAVRASIFRLRSDVMIRRHSPKLLRAASMQILFRAPRRYFYLYERSDTNNRR